MEILTLLVKPKSFDRILSGEKKEEEREITPSTQNKYILVTPEEVTIKLYDAIRFVSGNDMNAPEAIVKVEKTDLEYEPDEDGYIQLEETDEGQLIILDASMVYSLGNIIETKNIK